MKKIVLTAAMLLSSCSYYEQYSQQRIEEQTRLDAQYQEQAEADRMRGEEMERQRKEKQSNYVSAKANVECLKAGFRKGTNDFNQCTYVFSSDAAGEIKRRELQERENSIVSSQIEFQQEQNRKQQFFNNYMGISALNKQNNITCNTISGTTRCY